MTNRLSGQLDLTSLFDPHTAPAVIHSLALRTDDVARDSDAIFAVIGSPGVQAGLPARD
jgi:hypothetical protein